MLFRSWLASVLRGIPVYFVQDIETSYYPDDALSRHAVINSYHPEFHYMTISSWNRERLHELKAAEEQGGGRAPIEVILRALVGPTLRGCLGPENQRSTAARFMIRASIESVPPIRRIKNREFDHLRKFAAAMRRSLPDRSSVDLYWCLHFALAMAHQTIRDSERLAKLSEGLCDLNDVQCIIERIVAVSVTALTGNEAANKMPARLVAREAR